MNINSLPYEIVTSCFSYLNTELLSNIILLENIDDHIVRAVADHLNHLCYSKRTLGIYGGTIRGIEGIAGIETYYETDFDRFLRIHKILEEKSLKCPLWFHCSWNHTFQMLQSLDEIKLVYNGQELGIHGTLMGKELQDYSIFSDHDINLKITCLSLSFAYNCSINLDNFPKLKSFYGETCETIVDNNHPSLENLYLREVTFSSLPINLIKLFAKRCWIKMNESHPKLEALTVLALEGTQEPFNYSSLLRILWNGNLEHFSYIGYEVTDVDELISMIGPKVLHFGFAG